MKQERPSTGGNFELYVKKKYDRQMPKAEIKLRRF